MDPLQFLNSSDAPSQILSDILTVLWHAFAMWWWIIIPPILFYVFLEYWISYHKEKFVESISWVTLQLKVPRDILTTPKVMEQVFSGFQVIASTPDDWVDELKDRKIPYQEGKQPLWVSFELVASHDGISFFVHTPKDFRKLVETQFRSQYPQMTIEEVPDYVSRFPSLPNAYIDTWGAELAFNEASVFPIKTYDFFESRVEEQRMDSLAPLLEIMSHLREGEEVWTQILVRGFTKPQAGAWKTESKAKLDELLGKKASAPAKAVSIIEHFIGFFMGFADTFKEYLYSLAGMSAAKKEEKKEEKDPSVSSLTPGQKSRFEEVEDKLAHPVYECVIRVLYHAPKTIFDKKGMSNAIKAYFRTYTISNSNGFKEKKGESPALLIKWLFGGNIDFNAARDFFDAYKNRVFDEGTDEKMMEKIVLSTEELATLYHFPISQLGTSALERVQTKVQGPPANLPTL